MIKISRVGQVHFARTWVKAKRPLDGRFSQRRPCRSMVVAKEIKLIMGVSQLAIRLEKGGITCNGLVQQIDRLQQICFHTAAKAQREKILGAVVEVESN